jgi:chorismate synthase
MAFSKAPSRSKACADAAYSNALSARLVSKHASFDNNDYREDPQMAGSSFGKIFRITTFGESHGKAIGVIVDGCPAGLPLSEEDIQPLLDRRRPGVIKHTTSRQEADRAEILSGTFEGMTTGTPIAIIIRNENQKSADYREIAEIFRPGHADYTFDAKYGFRDCRGGGRSSGRETAARTAGGAVALKLLSSLGIEVRACVKEIGGVPVSESEALLEAAASEKDSLGGIIECTASGVPAGLGEPVFDKLDAELAKAILSIGAVKGVEFGDGFQAAKSRGSQNNDAFRMDGGRPVMKTNHAGGILGGISSGADILLRAAVKPTPSIALPQETVTKDGRETVVSVHGRHDTCIVPRAAVVVEAMTALVLADALLCGATARLDSLLKIYGK